MMEILSGVKKFKIWCFRAKSTMTAKNREVRTFECNYAILITCLIADNYKRKDKEKEEKSCDFSSLVAGAGFEPTTFGL